MNLTLAPAALAFLFALAWKSTLVLAFAAVASAVLARRSAALRHGVWTLAVAALLALPILQAVTPPLGAPLPFAKPAPSLVSSAPAPSGLEVPRLIATPQGRVPTEAAPVTVPAPAAPWVNVPLLLFGVWLAGVAAVLAYFAAGRFALRGIARRARPLVDPTWQELAAHVGRSLGLRRLPRFLVATDGITPLTWGSTVLLPASATAWPDAQKRSFLVHELAHVARRDCAIQEWAHVACALYWFHPLAWFAAQRLRVEREQACDDLVLADGAGAEAYARQLLDVVRHGRVPRGAIALSGAAMAAPSQLQSRVRALLDLKRDRSRVGRARTIVATLAALALLAPLAALAPATSGAGTRAARDAAKAPSETLARGVLAERWERALAEGDGGDGPFWFAYAIDYDGGANGDETVVSDSKGWDSSSLSGGPTTLADRFSARGTDVIILLRVPERGRGEAPGFDRVALRSARLAPDLDGLGVVAIGKVSLEESFDWLSDKLDETPDDARATVLVTALSLHDTPKAAPRLIGLLDGRRAGEVRGQAAEGLARHPGHPALAALTKHANADRAIGVRREAAEALGDLAMPEATKPLIDLALECDERLVRAEAVESLGARDPESVVGVLVYVAKNDADEMVRREAVETLGDLEGDDGLKALRVLQRSSDPAVRSEVAETLHDMAERAQRR